MVDTLPPIGSDITATMGGMPPLAATFGTGSNIDKASQDFEAMFATQLLQPMFETVNVDPTFGGGHGEEMMRSFLLQEYGKIIAKTGKLGIGTQVKKEMLRAQEAASARNAGVPVRGDAAARAANNAYANAGAQIENNEGEAHVSVQ
jgi:Rod binding domain-containing protein